MASGLAPLGVVASPDLERSGAPAQGPSTAAGSEDGFDVLNSGGTCSGSLEDLGGSSAAGSSAASSDASSGTDSSSSDECSSDDDQPLASKANPALLLASKPASPAGGAGAKRKGLSAQHGLGSARQQKDPTRKERKRTNPFKRVRSTERCGKCRTCLNPHLKKACETVRAQQEKQASRSKLSSGIIVHSSNGGAAAAMARPLKPTAYAAAQAQPRMPAAVAPPSSAAQEAEMSKMLDVLRRIMGPDGRVGAQHLPELEALLDKQKELGPRQVLLTILKRLTLDCQRAAVAGRCIKALEEWVVETSEGRGSCRDPDARAKLIKDVLECLVGLPVDREALRRTGIGRTLARLPKTLHPEALGAHLEDVVDACKRVVDCWRKLAQAEEAAAAAAAGGNSAQPMLPTAVTAVAAAGSNGTYKRKDTSGQPGGDAVPPAAPAPKKPRVTGASATATAHGDGTSAQGTAGGAPPPPLAAASNAAGVLSGSGGGGGLIASGASAGAVPSTSGNGSGPPYVSPQLRAPSTTPSPSSLQPQGSGEPPVVTPPLQLASGAGLAEGEWHPVAADGCAAPAAPAACAGAAWAGTPAGEGEAELPTSTSATPPPPLDTQQEVVAWQGEEAPAVAGMAAAAAVAAQGVEAAAAGASGGDALASEGVASGLGSEAERQAAAGASGGEVAGAAGGAAPVAPAPARPGPSRPPPARAPHGRPGGLNLNLGRSAGAAADATTRLGAGRGAGITRLGSLRHGPPSGLALSAAPAGAQGDVVAARLASSEQRAAALFGAAAAAAADSAIVGTPVVALPAGSGGGAGPRLRAAERAAAAAQSAEQQVVQDADLQRVAEEISSLAGAGGKKHKRVHWPDDDSKLQLVRWFRRDDPPSSAKFDAPHGSARGSGASHAPGFEKAARQEHARERAALAAQHEQEERERAAMLDKLKEMTATLGWHAPPLLPPCPPEWNVAAGGESAERHLMAVKAQQRPAISYPTPNHVPPSPAEPPADATGAATPQQLALQAATRVIVPLQAAAVQGAPAPVPPQFKPCTARLVPFTPTNAAPPPPPSAAPLLAHNRLSGLALALAQLQQPQQGLSQLQQPQQGLSQLQQPQQELAAAVAQPAAAAAAAQPLLISAQAHEALTGLLSRQQAGGGTALPSPSGAVVLPGAGAAVPLTGLLGGLPVAAGWTLTAVPGSLAPALTAAAQPAPAAQQQKVQPPSATAATGGLPAGGATTTAPSAQTTALAAALSSLLGSAALKPSAAAPLGAPAAGAPQPALAPALAGAAQPALATAAASNSALVMPATAATAAASAAALAGSATSGPPAAVPAVPDLSTLLSQLAANLKPGAGLAAGAAAAQPAAAAAPPAPVAAVPQGTAAGPSQPQLLQLQQQHVAAGGWGHWPAPLPAGPPPGAAPWGAPPQLPGPAGDSDSSGLGGGAHRGSGGDSSWDRALRAGVAAVGPGSGAPPGPFPAGGSSGGGSLGYRGPFGRGGGPAGGRPGRVCAFFNTPAGCKKGDSCNFLHVRDGGDGGTTGAEASGHGRPGAYGR